MSRVGDVPTARSAPLAGSRVSIRRNARHVAVPLVTTVGILVVAELASRSGLVAAEYVPPVSAVLQRTGQLAGEGALWAPVGETVVQSLGALGIATVIAVPLGLLTGLSEVADDVTAYVIELLRPVPAVALIPLFILLVGTGTALAVALGIFAATWPLLIQTRAGLRETDQVALDTARVFGLPRVARLRWVLLPSAASHIATGLRLSASLTLILAISAQLVAGSPGIGQEIALAQSAGDTVTMYAYVLVAGLLGVLLNAGIGALERPALAWHPSQRAGMTR